MLSKTELSIFEYAGLLYSATQNQTGYEYTDIATGDLDFERLVNEEVKCWRLPVSAQELKQKKIIITDLGTRFKIYTSRFVASYEDRHLPEFELWVALLDYGFELYAWTGNLVPLKNIEDLLKYLFIIEPVKPSLLVEKLSKLNINKDECFFVTTENRASLQEKVFINQSITIKPSYKTLSNSLLLLMSLPYDLLQAYLDTLEPDTPFTIECSLSTILKYDCTTFLKKIAYLNPEIHLSRLQMANQFQYHQLLARISNYPPELCQFIKSYRIEDLNIPEQRLLDLFGAFTCLETFEIRDVAVTESKIDPYQVMPAFNPLKRLILSNTELTNFHFCMLNNSPDLEQLVIHNCNWNNCHFPLKKDALKSVKILACEQTEKLDDSFLIHTLNATLCLEALRVDRISVPDDILATLDGSRLQHLTELEITEVLSITDIAFMNLCSNLESLTVSTICNQEEIFYTILNQCNLPRLRQITFINNGQKVMFSNFEGCINHNWDKFNIDDFENRMETFSQLHKDAQKTNFLTLLKQDHIDGSNGTEIEKQELFDGDTGPNNDILTVTEYFRRKGAACMVDKYRLNTFQLGQPGKQLCFDPIPAGDFETIEILQKDNIEDIYKATYEETTDVFLGTLELFPKDHQKWIKLPSFTPSDDILMVSSLENGEITLRRHDNHFYYVKINTNHADPVAFQFLLKTPGLVFDYPESCTELQHTMILETCFNVFKRIQFNKGGKSCLSKQFHADFNNIRSLSFEKIVYVLSEFCLGFSVEELLPGDNRNSWKQLNQVIRERKGSCRHRAKVFVVLASIFGIQAELVQNDCHAFVLIWYPDSSWRIQDLGGDESRLEIINVNKAIEKRKENLALKHQTIHPDNPYILWKWQKSHAKTWKSYCAELLQSTKKNILISLDHAQIEDFLANLQVLQKNSERQYIYIDNLDNIRTTQTVVENNGEKNRQDSVLISSIKNARPGDVLVMNCFVLKAEHMVYNTIMDTQRRMLKGTDLPEGLILICLQPNDRSESPDFHTRFQLRSKCPVNLQSDFPFPPVVKTLDDAQKKLLCINMYFPEEYRQLMTVRFASNGSTITVVESLLITALKQNHPGIIIRNAPWDNLEFRTFLSEMLYSRRFHANGDVIEIPDDFSFILWDKPYKLHKEHLLECECEPGSEPDNLKVLNNLTYKSFFKRFRCQNGQFPATPGWIEHYAGQKISVLLTHDNLSQIQKALLSKEARKHSAIIEVYKIKQNVTESMAVEDVIDYIQPTCPVIQTADLDLAEKLYFSDTSVFTVIPVSEETRYSDLIERFENQNGYYQHQICCVTDALLQGKHVVLKGELSPLLQKQLSSLLLANPYLIVNGQQGPLTPGQFRLLSINATNSKFFQCQTLQLPEPWHVLSEQFAPPLIEQAKQLCEALARQLPQEPAFSYIQLQTILLRLVQKPDSNPLKSILRLKSNYLELKPIIEELWEVYDPVGKYMSFKPNNIMTHRIQKVCNELKFSPHVFVAGSSGSGKSTLFLRQWELYITGTKIYCGLDKIKEWFQSTYLHPCLVVEEANLLSKDAFVFLELLFKGLILIEGMLLPISPRHKIIFIGNFGYFNDRNQQAFFNRHGHIITFKELPDSFLTNNILLPILSTRREIILENQADILLKAYQKIRLSVGTSVSIRNLEMLAWRFLENLQYSKKHNESLCLALYDEFQIFFTDSTRSGFKQEMETCKAIKAELKDLLVFNVSDFVLTPSRRNPLRLIDQFLHIRELKSSTDFYFTGIQGFILEGDSAEGKSSLLQHYLDSNSFVLANEDNIDHPKRYYIIDDLDTLEMVLFKAFHEGALVIINEINTLPVELLLNHYMSGVDRNNQPAKRKGFAVLGTQNPISFDFRKPLSPALLNRFQMIYIKEYKPEEINIIANSYCEQIEDAQNEANQYVAARSYAKNHGFLRPNVRTLVNNCNKKRKADEDINEREFKRVCYEK